MLDPYTVGICLGKPVIVFRAEPPIPLPELLGALDVRKGGGEGAFRLHRVPKKGAERIPSNLLYIEEESDQVLIVGAVDAGYDMNHEFAIYKSLPELVLRAESLAQPLYTLEPANYDEMHKKFGER